MPLITSQNDLKGSLSDLNPKYEYIYTEILELLSISV